MLPLREEWPFSTSPFKPQDIKDLPRPDTVGICIPAKDGLKFFKLAVYSVLSFTDHPHMLTVVDNQSTYETKKFFSAIGKNHNANILRYDDEFNFAAECNLAMKFMFQWSTVRYGLILNADAIVSPNWLSNMVRTLNSNPRIGIVGPVSNKALPEQMDPANFDRITPALRVSGFCMLFRREVYEELGGFDEQFLSGGFEDWDFCERALRANWKVMIDGGIHIHHFYKMFRKYDYDVQLKENEKKFFAKHPLLVDYVQEVGS